jgi:hypothetical protein
VPNQPSEDEQSRRRRWLLLLLLLLLLLIFALIAFVSCGRTAQPGPVGASPNTVRTASVTFEELPTATPCCSPPSPSAATMLTVPNVVGMEADAADMKLRDTGFSDVTFVDTAGKPAALLQSWVVSKQSVAAGGSVPATAPIVLTVTERTNGKG